MIVLVGGQKGGTGKTTIATNLAAWLAHKGKDVLLVEGNPTQGSSTNWASRREETDHPQITCIEKSGNIYKTLKELSSKYDEVIVDTGGQDSKEFRTALLAADMLISPVRPSQKDVETLILVSELVDRAQEMNEDIKACVLITQASPNPKVKDVSEIKELMKELPLFHLLKSVIVSRKIYADVDPLGTGVIEMANKKARREIKSLAKEIYNNDK